MIYVVRIVVVSIVVAVVVWVSFCVDVESMKRRTQSEATDLTYDSGLLIYTLETSLT